MGGSVDGLVSGMDTTSVINQLMSLERQPQLRLEQRKAAAENKIKAYQSVNSKLAALQSNADALTKADTWKAFKVTSSTTGVSASATTKALPGSYTFEVLALAKAHAQLSATTYTSTAQRVTNAVTITITQDGETTDPINVGDGSLASVVSAVNAADVGVRAAAVQVADGQYKLSLTSATTGVDGAFTVDGAALGAMTTITTGADARIGMGDPVGGVYPAEITSASNTFTDVLTGVSFTVSKLESATLNVKADGEGMAAKVAGLVTSANAVLEEIAKLTAYDQATKRKSVLTGDATMRGLQQRLLDMVSTSVGGRSLSEVGVELTRAGRLEFDKATFDAEYASDPAGTEALFRPGGTATHPTLTEQPASLSLVFAGDQTPADAYDVVVTRAARQATVTLTGAIAGTESLTLRVGTGDPLVVAAQPGDDADALVQRLNDAIAGASMRLVASNDAGQVVVRAVDYGSTAGFTLTSTGGTLTTEAATARVSGAIAGTETVTITVPSLAPVAVAAQVGDTAGTLAARINTAITDNALGLVAEVKNGAIVFTSASGGPSSFTVSVAGGTALADVGGVDVAGSIDGVDATDSTGRILAAPAAHATLWGLSLEVAASQAQVDTAAVAPNNGLFGTFTYKPGFAQKIDSFAGDAIRSGTGQLTTVIDGNERLVEDLDTQITSWDQRLAIRELALRRRFTNLETTLGRLRDQSNWLAGQLGSLGGSAPS